MICSLCSGDHLPVECPSASELFESAGLPAPPTRPPPPRRTSNIVELILAHLDNADAD